MDQFSSPGFVQFANSDLDQADLDRFTLLLGERVWLERNSDGTVTAWVGNVSGTYQYAGGAVAEAVVRWLQMPPDSTRE